MLLAQSDSPVKTSYFTGNVEQTILAQKALSGVFAYLALNALLMKDSCILKSEQFGFFPQGNIEWAAEQMWSLLPHSVLKSANPRPFIKERRCHYSGKENLARE